MENQEIYIELLNTGIEWIRKIAQARLAQKSVIFINTDDPWRQTELANRLRGIIKAMGPNPRKFEETAILVVFDGYTGIDPDYTNLQNLQISSNGISSSPMGISDMAYNVFLRQIWQEVGNKRDTAYIILLSNIEYLRDTTGRLRELEAIVNRWLNDTSILESGTTLIIFTQNASGITKYLTGTPEVIHPPLSTDKERMDLISTITSQAGLHIKRATLKHIVALTRGLTIEQLDTIITKTIVSTGKLDIDILNRAKQEIIAQTDLLIPMNPQYGFNRIGGYSALKQYLKRNIIDILGATDNSIRDLGLRALRGLIFMGPPGTGKTLFARALSYEAKIPFFELGNIFSKWLGESEANINRIINYLETIAPAILFIDEIDALGQTRTEMQHETRRDVFSRILTWLGDDTRRTIVIGTTNVPEQLDSAFKRAGRFDSGIYIGYPNTAAREQIISLYLHLNTHPRVIGDVDIKYIATRTAYYTGAELKQIVERAKIRAYEKRNERGKVLITTEDLDEAVKSVRIEVRQRKELEGKYIKQALDFRSPPELIETPLSH